VERILQQISVLGDDGAWLTAVELRFDCVEVSVKGTRTRVGSRRWVLSTGEQLRPLSGGAFEVLLTGEIVACR